MISAITSFTPKLAGILQPLAAPPAKAEVANSAITKLAAPAQKPFAEVAQDARKWLDKVLKTDQNAVLDDYGSKALTERMGELDRRTLYAIESNAGGLFDKREISASRRVKDLSDNKTFTWNRTEIAWLDGLDDRNLEFGRNMLAWLDASSSEEKATMRWAQRRAYAQTSVEFFTDRKGLKPENLESGNAVVNKFAEAHRSRNAKMFSGGKLSGPPLVNFTVKGESITTSDPRRAAELLDSDPDKTQEEKLSILAKVQERYDIVAPSLTNEPSFHAAVQLWKLFNENTEKPSFSWVL